MGEKNIEIGKLFFISKLITKLELIFYLFIIYRIKFLKIKIGKLFLILKLITKFGLILKSIKKLGLILKSITM